MNRRQLFGAGAALALATGLAGGAMAQDTDETVTIGVSIPSATHGFMGGLNWHAQDTVARLKEVYPQVEFILATAGESAKQVADIEDMLATRDIDALIVLPFESEPLTGPVKAVKDAGKFVTVVDRGLSVDGIEDFYVAGDNEAFGRVAGEYFKANLPEGAKIVILRGIPTTLDNERFDAFMSAIDGAGLDVLDAQPADWNRDKAFAVMQDYLSKYPEIDAVWAADDDMAIGALAAVEQAGRQDEMWMIGGAGMKDIVRRIMDSDPQLPVDVTYPPSLISAAMEMTALKYVSNAPISGRYIIGSVLITPKNAAEHYFPDSPF